MRIFISSLMAIGIISQPALSNPYVLQYGGRLVQSNGEPVAGPISVTTNFYRQASGGSVIAAQTFDSVLLTNGVFSLTISLAPADFNTVFNGSDVWIEVLDDSSGKIYPRQRFTAVPYALKVPVDALTIDYNSNGQLNVKGLAGANLPSTSPADGQVLKWQDGTGWEWGSDEVGSSSVSVNSATIQDSSITDEDIAANAAIAGTKVNPNFGSQNITTTGVISGNGSGLTNLPAGTLGTSIETSEITDSTIIDADISASASIGMSKINGLTTALSNKEQAIIAGTSTQYLRGDKSWATLDTSAVPEFFNLYYTDARARAAISGAGPVTYNSTSGVISMPAASSVASGYLSSGDWLTFSNKQSAITSTSTVDAGTLTSAQQNGVELKSYGAGAGQTGELRFNDATDGTSNYVGFKAPNSIASNKVWTLPASDGSTGQCLVTDGNGLLSWVTMNAGSVSSIIAGTGLSGGTITTSGTLSLANTGVGAGSYTRANITVDAQGRLTSASSGSNVNLATEVSGILAVGNGGTGSSTAAGARTNLGLGSLATLSAVGSSEITDTSITDADISSSAAIAQSKISGLSTSLSGKEAAITAGTTAQYYRGDKSWQTLNSTAVAEGSNLYYTDTRARAAVSGTAPISYNSSTGNFSMAAASSVANGYLSSGDWLTFGNKQSAITSTSTVNAGTLTSAQQNGVELKSYGAGAGQTGELRFNDATDGTSNYVGFKAPNSIASNKVWTLPENDGSSGQSLTTNGSGALSWSNPVQPVRLVPKYNRPTPIGKKMFHNLDTYMFMKNVSLTNTTDPACGSDDVLVCAKPGDTVSFSGTWYKHAANSCPGCIMYMSVDWVRFDNNGTAADQGRIHCSSSFSGMAVLGDTSASGSWTVPANATQGTYFVQTTVYYDYSCNGYANSIDNVTLGVIVVYATGN